MSLGGIFIKTIGVITRNFSENNKNFIGAREDLFKTLMNFDVCTLGIPISMDFKYIKKVVDKCDGIVLSGGDNFCENDFLLVDYLYKNDIPTLGICLGMQSMGEYFNDRNEIRVENHHSLDEYVHKIKIEKGSLLYKIIGKSEINVNSRHHNAITKPKLKISAISEDDIIEAVEDANKKFFLGVEWHPESLNDENTKKLFEYFINHSE